MKPLTKQNVYLPISFFEEETLRVTDMFDNHDNNVEKKLGYFFTEQQLKEFIGEVFDKGTDVPDIETLNLMKQDWLEVSTKLKQELIKQLLQ